MIVVDIKVNPFLVSLLGYVAFYKINEKLPKHLGNPESFGLVKR
jgi:hypothetical protein